MMQQLAVLIATALDPFVFVPALALGVVGGRRAWDAWAALAAAVAIGLAHEALLTSASLGRVFRPDAALLAMIAAALWSALAWAIARALQRRRASA